MNRQSKKLTGGFGLFIVGLMNNSPFMCIAGVVIIVTSLMTKDQYKPLPGRKDTPFAAWGPMYSQRRRWTPGPFTVRLQARGADFVGLINALRTTLDMGLQEAKIIACSGPVDLKSGISRKDAEFVKYELLKTGATVVITEASAGKAQDTEASEPQEPFGGTFDVVLESSGRKKTSVVTLIEVLFFYDRSEAACLVDAAPAVLKRNVSPAEAAQAKAKLEEIGATVALWQSSTEQQESAPEVPQFELAKQPGPVIPPPGPPATPPASPQPVSTPTTAGKNSFDLVLVSVPVNGNKVPVRKALKQLLGMDLVQAYNAVEQTPHVLREKIPRQEAESLKRQLEAQGAIVEIR